MDSARAETMPSVMTDRVNTAWSGRGPHPLAGRTIPRKSCRTSILGPVEVRRSRSPRRSPVSARGRRSPARAAVSSLSCKPRAASGCRFRPHTKNPLAMALNQAKLAELIGREGVALVHAAPAPPPGSPMARHGAPARRSSRPFSESESGLGAFKRNYNAVMAKGDIVIANSAFTARHIAELYPAAAARIRIVEPGIELNLFNPSMVDWGRVLGLRRTWNVTTEERVVLLPARLSPRKGHLVLIEAARLLRRRGSRDVKFILAGEEQGRAGYVKEIDAAIAKAGLGGLVVRTGHCDDMPAALLAAAVVAVPSTEPEALGRVAAEAQAMGTPAVVSDIGALGDIIATPPDVELAARTGWRVPPGDARALAAALYDVLTLGASAREGLSQRARSRALARSSITRMQAETLAAYSALTGAHVSAVARAARRRRFTCYYACRIDFAPYCADFHLGPGTFVMVEAPQNCGSCHKRRVRSLT